MLHNRPFLGEGKDFLSAWNDLLCNFSQELSERIDITKNTIFELISNRDISNETVFDIEAWKIFQDIIRDIFSLTPNHILSEIEAFVDNPCGGEGYYSVGFRIKYESIKKEET